MSKETDKLRCEGWTRHGGVFTFGPIEWSQCEKDAVVLITFTQKEEKENTLPACKECWQKCIESENITIISVCPVGKDNVHEGAIA